MKQKEWVRSERRRLHRSERRLQILSAFALSGGESPFSKEKTWIDLVARMRHYFTLPVVLCHAPCMTCGNDTEPNVYGFGGVGAIGYGAKEKCLRRMIDDGLLRLDEKLSGWQLHDTATGRAYLSNYLGAVDVFIDLKNNNERGFNAYES